MAVTHNETRMKVNNHQTAMMLLLMGLLYFVVSSTSDMSRLQSGIAPYLYHFAPVFRVFAQLLGVKLGSTGPKDLKQLMEDKDTPMAIVPGTSCMTL